MSRLTAYDRVSTVLMTWLVASSLGVFAGQVAHQEVQAAGVAKHYAPGRMERVAVVRGLAGTRDDVTGYAATPDCGRIGEVVSASFRNPRTEAWGPVERLLVVDCSAPRDRARHIAEGLVVETDFATARRGGWEWDGYEGEGKTAVKLLGFSR